MQIVDTSDAGERLSIIREHVQPQLEKQLVVAPQSMQSGAPVFIRIFKESSEMEVWLRGKSEEFVLFKTYPIANYGGGSLAPKLAEGDGQAPTGFYTVARAQLKPDSDYHLAFNLGFPNAYDRKNGRTGSFLMVHGRSVSIGCYAMTDPLIEEIYLLVESALDAGQKSVRVHAFPFRMTDARMQIAATNADESPWLEEWRNLQQGHDMFEKSHIPPLDRVDADGRYTFE
ncbi:MAG: murein L,D-transpeptidase YafK [Verrucomicrobiales bacterium]|jgi:murein L,D-transpeptidase YafK